MKERWRVGSKIAQNVYEGDRPVCQCHSEEDAREIARSVNFTRAFDLSPREVEALPDEIAKPKKKASGRLRTARRR